MTLTIEIEDKLQSSLETMAFENGKKIDQFVADIIDDYIDRSFVGKKERSHMMALSEGSFDEWDNEEDAVYDHV